MTAFLLEATELWYRREPHLCSQSLLYCWELQSCGIEETHTCWIREGPGCSTTKEASVVIHSTLVYERRDKEFSVTGFFNLGSIKSIFHQTYNHKHVRIFIFSPERSEAERRVHPQH